MKLYRVKLKGFQGGEYENSFVLSNSMDEAYKKVRKFLDKNDIGYSFDRELHSVTLIADSDTSSNGSKLYL